MHTSRFVLSSVALIAISACAHGPQFLPSDRESALRRTERVGRALYEADELAAKGTDALLAATRGGQAPAQVQGYVVRADTKHVVFLGKTFAGVMRYAEVTLGGPSASVRTTEEPADPTEAAMFAALLAARAEFKPVCERVYNPIVIADPDQPNWLVYFLASTTDPDEVVIGGHVRAIVSKSDGKLLDLSPLSKSCMSMGRREVPAGAKTAAIVVSHPLEPIPAETHVYVSLLHSLPLFVLGNEGAIWNVEAGKISPVR